MGRFGTGMARICAVVAESTAAKMAAQVKRALHEASTVELRLDWLASDAERSRFLRWLQGSKPRRAVFLATCRRREAGGLFPGSIKAQLCWLAMAREAGCLWCDIEVETLRKLPDQSVRDYAVPPRVMLSMHDFRRTPPLARSINPPRHGEVDAIKVAAHARTIADSVRLLHFARRPHPCPTGRECLGLRAGSAGHCTRAGIAPRAEVLVSRA